MSCGKNKKSCISLKTHGHIAEIEFGRCPVDVCVYTRKNTDTEEKKDKRRAHVTA